MIRRGEESLVIRAPETDALLKIAHRNAGVAGLVIIGVGEHRQQPNQAAVAPARDSDTPGINIRVTLEHPQPRRVDILDLQSTVINQSPEILSVAAAAAVIGRDDGVALLHQLANDVRLFVTSDVAVNFAMRQHDERELARTFFPGQEGHRGNDHVVAGCRQGRGIVGRPRRRSGETDLIHQRDVTESLQPKGLVHLAGELVVEMAETVLERAEARFGVVGLCAAACGGQRQREEQKRSHAIPYRVEGRNSGVKRRRRTWRNPVCFIDMRESGAIFGSTMLNRMSLGHPNNRNLMESRLENRTTESRFSTEKLVDDLKAVIDRAEKKAVERAKAADKVVREHP